VALVLLLLGALAQALLAGLSVVALLCLLPALLALLWCAQRLHQQARVLAQLSVVADEVAHGKFERRLTHVASAGALGNLCWNMNDMLDQIETCFREQATALAQAAQGNFARKSQTTGLRGGFLAAQQATNGSLGSMESNVR